MFFRQGTLQMSSRRNSINQTPLRRVSIKANSRRKSVLRNITVETDTLHDESESNLRLRHLRPSFQKFWQVAIFFHAFRAPFSLTSLQRSEAFSPRSSRLSRMIPPPLSSSEATLVRLGDMQGQVCDTIARGNKIQVLATLFLRRYFELIPPYQARTLRISTFSPCRFLQ